MIINQKIYDSARSKELIELKCNVCENNFFRLKKFIKHSLKMGYEKHCCNSPLCQIEINRKGKIYNCFHCGASVYRRPSDMKKTKSNKVFCNNSCARFYNNAHKTTGTRRSKLEIYIENQLKQLYPNLVILFNDKTTINSELDIYIPNLKLAFELNGIFHYEDIFGKEKLNQTQSNDSKKFYLCQQNKISLCVIDVSGQKYFKEPSSLKYLKIITNIINNKLSPKS